MRLGVPFIAPRDIGAIGAPFGRLWLPSVRRCAGLSSAHWTVNSATTSNPMIGCLPVLGAPDYLVLLLTVGPWPTWQLVVERLAHQAIRRLARTVQ